METTSTSVQQQQQPPRFGQLVIGPPGCGKTTYCRTLQNYFNNFNRKTLLINLDPANETTSNIFDIDIRSLITLDDASSNLHLGPNSSFIYCFNFLNENFSWLQSQLNSFPHVNYYLIDTPGQIELFTTCPSFKAIITKLTHHNEMNIHLTCVNLIESINICDMSKYIFSCMSVLNAMINLELPQVNLISKSDMIKELKKENEFPFDLEFFKNPNNEIRLNEYLDSLNMGTQFKELNKKIAEFICDYGLVSFSLFDVGNVKHVNRAVYLADKGNGFIYKGYVSGEEEEDEEAGLDSRLLIAENDLEDEERVDEEYQI
jgi:GTPase SAR1 family protein